MFQAAASALATSAVDFQWLADRTALVLTGGAQPDYNDNSNSGSGAGSSGNSTYGIDPWVEFISICMHPDYVLGQCPMAVQYAWPTLYTRLQVLCGPLDPV